MADLLPNIPVTASTMVDLYAASGISVGTKIRVINNGNARIRLYTKATEPNPNTDGYIMLTPCRSESTSVAAENVSGDSGAWAYSMNADGLVNVQDAS